MGENIGAAFAFLDNTRRQIEHEGMAGLFQTPGAAA